MGRPLRCSNDSKLGFDTEHIALQADVAACLYSQSLDPRDSGLMNLTVNGPFGRAA
jgi:hypothetical protein